MTPQGTTLQSQNANGHLEMAPPRTIHSKLLTADEAERKVDGWHEARFAVAFANGCFDIVHRGHIHLIERARASADRLIIGVNSDHSVRGLKGPSRPICRQDDRAALLAALESVDAVVLFDEPTPLALILRLRPDQIVKGADYEDGEIVGANEVRGWGGTVLRVPLLEGCSTSQILAQIQQKV